MSDVSINGNQTTRRLNSMKLRSIAGLALLALIAPMVVAQTVAISPLAPSLSSNAQTNQFKLGHLTVTGNKHTKLFVIMRMIPLDEGDLFNQSLWDFGIDQLNRSGLFEPIQPGDVVMKPDSATGLIDIELRVKERDHQRVDFS